MAAETTKIKNNISITDQKYSIFHITFQPAELFFMVIGENDCEEA
jgi:hypothetical protein